MNLTSLLKLAYSAERAAAFAYQGHAGSVQSTTQKVEIKKIEDEEWLHRDNLMRMMNTLELQPSKWLEFKYYSIGKLISGSCYVIGYFMPMYFAGRLESSNVNEYIKMVELVKGTALESEIPCILEMASVEKEHEQYFLNQIQDHWMLPLFQRVFGWGPGLSYNTISLTNKTVD